VVFVIDTGGDYNHSDLQANSWVNPNGWADDIYGIDVYNNDADPSMITTAALMCGALSEQ